MSKKFGLAWLFASAILLMGFADVKEKQPEYDFPKSIGIVNDFSGILTPKQKETLVLLIRQHEKETTTEIAVVIMDSIKPHTDINTYATSLFNAWGIGKVGKNNGVLLLVALKDRKLCIEVGLGLENRITNEIADRIIKKQMFPEFKKSQPYQGILNGVEATLRVLTKKADVQPVEQTMPITVAIDIERNSDGISYSLAGNSTSDATEFSSMLATQLKSLKEAANSTGARLYLQIKINGHAEVTSLSQLKKMLSPHGFDQLTVLPSPQTVIFLVATQGKPTEVELNESGKLYSTRPQKSKNRK